MQLQSIHDADIAEKRVLLRVDFNVPFTDSGAIAEDSRIKAVVPTIVLLKQKGAAHITLMTHVGRPEGKVDEALRTAPLFKYLSELTDTTGVEMLENLRFDAREEVNDVGFAQELASHGDVFVNDAFAVCHRAAASTVGVAAFLPAYAGLLVEKEVAHLSEALMPPVGSVAIIGGAKLETKLPLIAQFSSLYTKVCVGGALANEYAPTANDTNVSLPSDGVPQHQGMLDIGPQTAAAWAEEIRRAPFVLWNGPVGMYEKPEYRHGTDTLARAIAEGSCRAVLGGGDTDAALAQFTFDSERVFISTGGGAMLEFLANGGTLPALEVLKNPKVKP
ncbi:MAG: phosphoglycerate kinase [bacterium]